MYWLVFAFSSGILVYYWEDVSSLVKASNIPNPLFYLNFSNLESFYYSGIVWYPSGHLEIVLAFGPLIFSVILSLLFSLNIGTIVYSFKFVRRSTGKRSTGFSSLLGLIPALFSAGCCSVPVGFLIIGSFVPLVGLRPILYFFYAYPALINTFFSFLLVVTLYYALRRMAKLST